MKVMITLQRSKTHRYLINLLTKSLIDELRDLVGNREYARALNLVYSEGSLEREILEHELHAFKADLILSDRYANWDLKI